MNFWRASIVCIIYCFGLEKASAQTLSNCDIIIGVNTGVGFAKATDERFSRSVQSGNPVLLGIDGSRKTDKSILSASFDYSFGDFKYRQNKTVGIFRKSTETNLSYARRLLHEQLKYFEIYLGLNIGLIWTQRDYTELLNNNKSYEILLPVDLKLLVAYKFGSSSPFKLQNKILFSAAGLYKQSAFGNVGTSDNSSEKWELTSLNRLTRFYNQTLLTLSLAPRHNIGLNYTFKNYSLTTGRNVKYFEHLVGVCYKLNL